jgi:NAD-dependent SIR2 family protein deacetylase
MTYKVFDFQCKSKKCKHILVDHMIDEEKEEPPRCPICNSKMIKLIGTDWVPHVSWGQWHIS